jgi:hypothetical protein
MLVEAAEYLEFLCLNCGNVIEEKKVNMQIRPDLGILKEVVQISRIQTWKTCPAYEKNFQGENV